jgi:hypothetical protein
MGFHQTRPSLPHVLFVGVPVFHLQLEPGVIGNVHVQVSTNNATTILNC